MAHKILLIDDEQGFLDTLKNFLEERGYATLTACDGDEGLKKFLAESPDLVLLDLKMPKKDGYEFLRSVRAQKRWVPVIVVSALAEPKDIFKGYKYEADYYLTKPLNLESLSMGIQVMLSLVPLRKNGII
jgi:DNA-binding response OmpR family regulator